MKYALFLPEINKYVIFKRWGYADRNASVTLTKSKRYATLFERKCDAVKWMNIFTTKKKCQQLIYWKKYEIGEEQFDIPVIEILEIVEPDDSVNINFIRKLELKAFVRHLSPAEVKEVKRLLK